MRLGLGPLGAGGGVGCCLAPFGPPSAHRRQSHPLGKALDTDEKWDSHHASNLNGEANSLVHLHYSQISSSSSFVVRRRTKY